MSDIDKGKLAEELKQARRRVAELEAALRDRSQKSSVDYNTLKAFFESATDSFSIWDANLKLVYLNDATLTKYYPPGTKRADVIGKHFTELVPGTRESGRYEQYIKVLNTGEPIYIEGFTPHTKFGDMHLAIRVFKIDDGLGIITTDITERKRMEDALKKSEENLRRVFQNLGDIVIVSDLTGKAIDVNETATRVSGYTKQELISGNGFIFISEKDRQKALDYLTVVIKQGSSDISEFNVICKDGHELPVEAKATLLHDSLGKPSGLVCLMRDITERKRMEDDLRESRERLKALIDNAPDIVLSYDTKGKFLSGNKRAEEILGYAQGDMLGKTFAESGLFTAESLAKTAARLEAYKRGKTSGAGEYELIAKDGTHIFVEVRGVPIVRKDSIEIIAIARDITERKRMEAELRESQERMSALVENAPDIIYSYDFNGLFLYGNKKVQELLGYSAEELIGKSIAESGLLSEEGLLKAMAKVAENRRGLVTGPDEYELITKDGSRVFVDARGVPIVRGDKAEVLCIAHDITERKQTEEKLRQSEEKFRVIFNSIADGISVIDLNSGKLIDTNEAALRMFNFTREDVIGTSSFDLIAEKDRPGAIEDFARTLEKGYSGLNQWCLLGKGGTEHDCEATSAVIRDKSGKPVCLVNVMRDISERKRMEEKLRQSEEKLRRIFESIGDAITIIDMNGKIIDANEIAIRMSGSKREEHIGRYSLDLLAERDRARAIKDMTEAFRTGYSDIKEYTVLRKDGSEFPAETTSTVLRDASGEPVGLVNILRDITERKRMEEKLRQSEEKIRQIFNSVGVGISVTDMEGNVVEVNDVGLRLCGYSKEEMIGHNGIRFIAERDRPRIIKEMISAFETGKSGIHEFTALKKDGTEYETETIVTVMRDSSGKPAGLITSVTDITERKRIERELNNYKTNLERMVQEHTAELANTYERLRESEEWHRALVETTGRAGIGIAIIQSGEGREAAVVSVNDITCEISGYSREDLLNMSVEELIPSDVLGQIMAKYRERRQGEPVPHSYETVFMRKDKVKVSLIVSVALMQLRGKPATVAFFRDITERKRMEEALKESEEKLRAIFEAIEDGIAVSDLEGKLIDMNESDVRLFGYERKEQSLNANGFQFVTEADRPRVIRDMSEVLTSGRGKIDRYRLMDKNGKEFDAEVSGSLLRDSQGKPTAIVNIIRDITERKRMEEAIRSSEAKLRAILNNMSDGISVTDMSGRIVDENEPGAKLMGFASREEVLGMNGFDFIAEVDRDRILKELARSLTRGYGGTYQVKLVDRYGEVFDSEITGSLLSDSAGKPTGLVCVMRDITERKRMEEALKESEAKYRTLVEQSDQGICILQNGRIVFANKALSKLNGYSLKELYAMSPEELLRLTVHPDDRETYAKRVKMRIEGKRLRPRYEYRVIRKDGTEICFETYSKRILYEGQPAIQSTMVDITERKQRESDLQRSKSDLSLYLSQINQAQEEERKRIARELHDDTIQEIIALSRQLDNLIDKRIGPEEERRENRRTIEEAQRKVDAILKGIRRFTRDLRPSILDDLGLVPALEWLTTDISEQFKIPIKTSIRGEEQNIAPDAALAMFRIAQESLRNACSHSGATHIKVDLKYTSQKVTLSITDNGQGFNLPEDTASLIRRGKLGVAGMYERAQLIGANLSIKSKNNKGTSVTLTVNIK